MSLRLNGSTSGYTELDAGAVAGNNTIKMPTANGSAYQVLRNGATAGTTEFADNIVSGTAQASTSGTSIDFTGIPSWVKRITVMLSGVSTSGSSNLQIQLGTGATPAYTTSGYLGSSSGGGTGSTIVAVNFTAGFGLVAAIVSTSVMHGAMTITNINGNNWVEFGVISLSSNTNAYMNGGSVSLAAALTAVRITTVNGTDTFDAGTINILYE
jgi:hypothetical protein